MTSETRAPRALSRASVQRDATLRSMKSSSVAVVCAAALRGNRASRRIRGRGQLAAQSQSRVIDPKLQCARRDKIARDALSRLTRFKRNNIPRARYFMCLTISDATAKMYLTAVVKFEVWSHRLHLPLQHLNGVDIAMMRFCH